MGRRSEGEDNVYIRLNWFASLWNMSELDDWHGYSFAFAPPLLSICFLQSCTKSQPSWPKGFICAA